MADLIKFNGSTLLTDSQGGVLSFDQGTIATARAFIQVARGDGELMKTFSSGGTDHTITFSFLNVPTASVSSTVNNILAYGKNTSIGTLEVTEFGFSANNCVISEVKLNNSNSNISSIADGFVSNTKARELEFTITFRQLI